MDLHQRTIVAEEVKRMLDREVEHAAIATYLRKADCSCGEAVALLAAIGGMTISQAKAVIFQSPSWSDERKRVAESHAQLRDIT